MSTITIHRQPPVPVPPAVRPYDLSGTWTRTHRRVEAEIDASLARGGLQASGFLAAVRHVIIVASCSRSGSSLFTELLKRSTQFLHCCGEINPFLRLAGLAWPESGASSDALAAQHGSPDRIRRLEAYLAAEFAPAGAPAAAIDADFIERLYRRLAMQWPLETFDLDAVRAAAGAARRGLEAMQGRAVDWSTDLAQFHVLLLARLRQAHPAINPYYYDLDRSLIAAMIPDAPLPEGPPSPIIIEEPPFVLVQPVKRWTEEDLATRALIIKTPSNVHRFAFFQELFPSAQIRILHLTRNPAASINGLRDGWRYRGFHSHYVGPSLDVSGYSRPGLPDWGWWKFDLPPGWRNYCEADLEHICAFQWRSAQRAILDHLKQAGMAWKRVRIEDVLWGDGARCALLDELGEWLGDGEFLRRSGALPSVMSTQPPRPGRWRDNAAELAQVLDDGAIRQLAVELGYGDRSTWI